MDIGTEWIIDAVGCGSDRLSDMGVLRKLCREIIDELRLQVVGEGEWHQFPAPGGVTALYLLTESHLSMHTYPEHGIATFNLYCCRARRPWPWEERLAACLGAKRVTVRKIVRGSIGSAEEEQTEEIRPEEAEEIR